MPDAEVAFQTITEVAPLIERKELSPVELATAQLDRIQRLDGTLKSYATVIADEALGEAREAEQEIASGRYRGPLHGIPVAVKDLCFTKGVRTMGGTPVLADHVPDFDATVVTRLRDAGAVLLGKLNLTEGAMGGYHRDFGIPVNPWRADRWSGASSSGSGVATAAGLCFASLGSDTGGSIRSPAAANGVVGLKPTWGRVSRYGVLALAESLDHVGPLTRSSRDAGLVLQAIAGPDLADATTLPDPVPDMTAEIDSGIAGLRVGLDRQYATADVVPAVSAAVLDAVAVLAGLGAVVVETAMPDVDPYVAAWPVLCGAEAAAAHADSYPSRADAYGPWFRAWLEMGTAVTGVDYARATHLRAELVGLLRHAFADIDVLACPARPAAAHHVTPDELYDARPGEFNDEEAALDRARARRFTAPFDMNGAPSITLPSGFDSDGMPLALQLVGHPLSEALLCRAGHAYEQATDWHTRRPPVDD